MVGHMNPVHTLSYYFFYILFNITSHLCLRLQRGLFPSSLPVCTLYALLQCVSCHVASAPARHWCGCITTSRYQHGRENERNYRARFDTVTSNATNSALSSLGEATLLLKLLIHLLLRLLPNLILLLIPLLPATLIPLLLILLLPPPSYLFAS
jgi:hypothetical protein